MVQYPCLETMPAHLPAARKPHSQELQAAGDYAATRGSRGARTLPGATTRRRARSSSRPRRPASAQQIKIEAACHQGHDWAGTAHHEAPLRCRQRMAEIVGLRPGAMSCHSADRLRSAVSAPSTGRPPASRSRSTPRNAHARTSSKRQKFWRLNNSAEVPTVVKTIISHCQSHSIDSDSPPVRYVERGFIGGQVFFDGSDGRTACR